MSRQAAKIRESRLEVLALSVDGIAGPTADTSAAYDLVDRTKFPFGWGLIDGVSVGQIHEFQRTLFDRTPSSSVPLAVLLDQAHRAVAIYRGDIPIEVILQDW